MVETVGKGNFENGSEQLCVDIDNKVDMIYTVCVIESRKSLKRKPQKVVQTQSSLSISEI